MANGYSLHIGLNDVDSTKYKGFYRKLRNAENDAKYYKELLDNHGYKAELLIGNDATSVSLLSCLRDFANIAFPGDKIFISYSGHGTSVPEVIKGSEADSRDEAMVLFDRLLIDNELQEIWPMFKFGVRIFFTNDSCYNGTVSRFLLEKKETKNAKRSDFDIITRYVEPEESYVDFQRNIKLYSLANLNPAETKCSIIHIASSLDGQKSDDGVGDNGDFTATFKAICEQGFRGSYLEFYKKIYDEMPRWQKPNWDTSAGIVDTEFETSLFLKI